jgi:predicted GNAT family acetyltransferase
MTITYKTTLEDVNWDEIKTKVKEDDFDNGRTSEQLKKSFENSAVACIAYAGDEVVGKARALSDGVCNAYIVDVWTYKPYRYQGIATQIMQTLFEQLPGQHVYLFTDQETIPFYSQLEMKTHGIGLGKLVGEWLVNETK